MNRDDVYQAELLRRKVLVNGDYDEFAQLLDDDVLWNHASGAVDTKDRLLDALRSGRTKYLAIEVRDETLRINGNVAFMNGIVRFKAEVGGVPRDVERRYSIAWVENDGILTVFNWHSSPHSP